MAKGCVAKLPQGLLSAPGGASETGYVGGVDLFAIGWT
jgi:hypothetical protein